MAWTLKNYQKGGVYDPERRAKPNIIALAKHIAEKSGMPDVRLQFTPGNYAHRRGLAVDIQPGGGSGNPEGMRALREVIESLDWNYWGIRYAAGMRYEYGGSWGGKERKRRQVNPYVGSDPYHDRHWHIDVHANAPERYPDMESSTPVDKEELSEAEVKEILEDLGKIKTAIERIERRSERAEAIATENQRRITEIRSTLSEGGYIHKRTTQTNHAVGRLEKDSK